MQVWSVQSASSGVVGCGVVVISEAVAVGEDISVVVVVSGILVVVEVEFTETTEVGVVYVVWELVLLNFQLGKSSFELSL